MIKVAEAIGSETGGKDGQAGDQTGNEILVRTFKKRSYEFTEYLRCTDRGMAARAAQFATRIAACSRFGYSQRNRWAGAKNIEAVGADRLEEAVAGDFDCSSLAIECYRLAGCPRLDMTGYTGNIRKLLKNTGYFEDCDLSNVETAQVGDLMNAPGIHVLIVVGGGSAPAPTPTPSTGQYVLVKGDNVRVRSGPSKDYKTILIAHKGNRFDYLGDDPETGWYHIALGQNVDGWITNKTKYTELV